MEGRFAPRPIASIIPPMRTSSACLLSTFFLVASLSNLSAKEPLFPFVVSYDAPANLTNVSDLLERPAGKRGFVHTEAGKLVVGKAATTKPIRFWATNICFEACFPSAEERNAWPLDWPG